MLIAFLKAVSTTELDSLYSLALGNSSALDSTGVLEIRIRNILNVDQLITNLCHCY